MRGTIAGVALGLACVPAQAFQSPLLPEAQHIVGMVVDHDGNPVAEASIEHTDDRQEHQTNSEGRFVLDTKAPILIIRKAGFRSGVVRTRDAKDVRVTLQKISGDGLFPICSASGSYVGIDGWEASFQFKKLPGVKASRQGQDIDYGARNYYVHTKAGPKGIRHGSGPMWSWGTPLDQDVWRSIHYEETVFNFGGQRIIDARGQLPTGNWWHYLGKFGESAGYRDMDENTANILDKFLDGACLKPATHP